jgi:hypothetical protein
MKKSKRRAEFGTVADVAQHCRRSDRTVRRWLADGLPHVKTGPAKQAGVLVRWSDLEKFLAARTVER